MTEAESQGKPKNSKYMIKLKACVFLKVLYSFELLITFFFWMLGTAIQNKRKIGSYRILSFHELLWLETCRIPDLWPYLLQNKSPGWSKKKKTKKFPAKRKMKPRRIGKQAAEINIMRRYEYRLEWL